MAPFSQHSSKPPNLRPMHVLVVVRLKSPKAASSVMISESIERISSLSRFKVSVCIPRFLCSGLILLSFFSASSALRISVRLRRFNSSRASSLVRIAFSWSLITCPWLAYWERAEEKWLRSVVDPLRISWGKTSVKSTARRAYTHTEIVAFIQTPCPKRFRRFWEVYTELLKSGTQLMPSFMYIAIYDLHTHDMRTAFSAVIRSCRGRKSWLPASAGIVELCAILVAAVLNMMSGVMVSG